MTRYYITRSGYRWAEEEAGTPPYPGAVNTGHKDHYGHFLWVLDLESIDWFLGQIQHPLVVTQPTPQRPRFITLEIYDDYRE